MDIDGRHLRQVLAIAEHGSFSRAAQELHLTQPALSRSIRALEGALGAEVFERGRTGVELTAVGRVVLRHAQATRVATNELLREVARLQGLEQGDLRIGAGPYGGAVLVGPVAGRLHRQHPRLNIQVIVAPWKELPARLHSRDLDLVVAELSGVDLQDDFEALPLTLQRLAVVCRPGHPLLRLRPATALDVLSYPLAGPVMPERAQQALAEAAHPGQRVSAAQAPRLSIECDSSLVLKDVLRQSDAISMMPWFMVRADVAAGSLDVVPGVDLGVTVRFGACWLKQRVPTAAAREFVRLLRAYEAEQTGSHPASTPGRQEPARAGLPPEARARSTR